MGRPRTWSRCTSSSAASPSSPGTDGRKTDAVSPRRRARTKRPMAWAKKSGVVVAVAYTPTASRGMSTPSLTMRTATIQRDSPAAKPAIRRDEPFSSERTRVGRSPDTFRSSAA